MKKLLIAVLVIECVLAICISFERIYDKVSALRCSRYVRVAYREIVCHRPSEEWSHFLRRITD